MTTVTTGATTLGIAAIAAGVENFCGARPVSAYYDVSGVATIATASTLGKDITILKIPTGEAAIPSQIYWPANATASKGYAVTGSGLTVDADISFQFAFDKTMYWGKLSYVDGRTITNITNGMGEIGLDDHLVASLPVVDDEGKKIPQFPPIIYNCDALTCVGSKEFDESKWRFAIIALLAYLIFIRR